MCHPFLRQMLIPSSNISGVSIQVIVRLLVSFGTMGHFAQPQQMPRVLCCIGPDTLLGEIPVPNSLSPSVSGLESGRMVFTV